MRLTIFMSGILAARKVNARFTFQQNMASGSNPRLRPKPSRTDCAAKFADIDAASSAPLRVTKLEALAEGISTVADDGPDPPSAGPAPVNALVPAPRPKEAAAGRFQWKPAFAQYSLEIAIQDAWRFAHEPGTRAATGNGPWFQDWIHSVGETFMLP